MNKFYIAILFASLTTLNSSCESRSKNKKAESQSAKSNSGKVIGIVDGDTYDILLEGNKTGRIRMEGIDAPEKGMPFYKGSKKHLSDLGFGKIVRIEVNDTDSHGRFIAYTYLNDSIELSQEMIKAGLAWHFKKYNSDSILAELENKARVQRIGLWVDESPMPPWINRELHRNGISTKDSFKILEHQR